MKLAVIGRVTQTRAIEGADRIQQACVDCADAGRWSGVVGLDVSVGQAVTVRIAPDQVVLLAADGAPAGRG